MTGLLKRVNGLPGLAVLAVGLLSAASLQAQDAVQVVMETEAGEILLELYPDRAPVTVVNFLRYVDGKHYDGATFYRTVSYANDNGEPKIEVIQGGMGSAEPPFDPIDHEDTEQTGIRHTDGAISMARGGVGTASSEFFIVIGDQPGLDKGQPRNADEQGFAAFGRVIDGMDVVRAIHGASADAPSDNPYTAGQIIDDPVVIRTVRRR